MSVRRLIQYALLVVVALSAGSYLGSQLNVHVFEKTDWSADQITRMSNYGRIFLQGVIAAWLLWFYFDYNRQTDTIFNLFQEIDERDQYILMQAYYLQASAIQYQDEEGVHYLTVKANFLAAIRTLLDLAQHDRSGSSQAIQMAIVGIIASVIILIIERLIPQMP